MLPITYKCINYWQGYVRLSILDQRPERFINLCMLQHVYVWDIRQEERGAGACVQLQHLSEIRRIARKSRTKVKIAAYGGIPFFWRSLCRRRMLAVGLVLFVVLQYCLATYIWVIDIRGVAADKQAVVAAFLAEQRIMVGASGDFMSKQIELQLQNNFAWISWVDIHRKGTQVIVEIVEKEELPPRHTEPADLVASKDAVITEIITLAGQPLVKRNDAVTAGTVLIEGRRSAANADIEWIQAKGLIKARVLYEAFGEAACRQTTYRRTGTVTTAAEMQIGTYLLPLWGSAPPPDSLYELECVDKKFSWWRNTTISVEFTNKHFYELQAVLYEQSPEAAREQAEREALAVIQARLPETAQIIKHYSEDVVTAEPAVVRVRAIVETLEDIAELRWKHR